MTDHSAVKRSPRDRILDAAADVLRSEGIVGATTKQIARAAGYSEAMLYKHFDDKIEIFLAVLTERLPAVQKTAAGVGEGDVRGTLEQIVEQFERFFASSFPMAASMLGSPALLARHREVVRRHGGGPEGAVVVVQQYIEGEQRIGRIDAAADAEAIAQTLVGFAFHQAFLAVFEGLPEPRELRSKARAAVAVVASSLGLPPPDSSR